MSVLYIKVKFKSFLCVCVCFPLYCYDRCIICGWLQEWKHDIIGSNIWLYHVGFKKENKDEHNLHCDYSLLWHLSWQHFFQTPNAWKVLEIEWRGLKPCLFFFVLFSRNLQDQILLWEAKISKVFLSFFAHGFPAYWTSSFWIFTFFCLHTRRT